MAKDTKKLIISTLLEMIMENQKITISEISKRSFITRATIMNNFPGGINEIIEDIHSKVIKEINHVLRHYDPNKLTLEQFADIVLPILWKNRKAAQIFYTYSVPFRPHGAATEAAWPWVGKRYNKLVKELELSPFFSGKELLLYWNAQLHAIFTLWLSPENPLPPEEFRSFFLLLTRTSINDLIYSGIK
jgi:AcrR family transcriptional regulator